MLSTTLRVSPLAFLALLLAVTSVFAQDSTTDIVWGDAGHGLQIGLPTTVIANRDYPTPTEAMQPLVIKVRNPTNAPIFYVNFGRFVGFDFHFLAEDGQKPMVANATHRIGSQSLEELAPGETKTIELEIPSGELKHFDLPLVASLQLWDKALNTRFRVFSPTMTFVVTD